MDLFFQRVRFILLLTQHLPTSSPADLRWPPCSHMHQDASNHIRVLHHRWRVRRLLLWNSFILVLVFSILYHSELDDYSRKLQCYFSLHMFLMTVIHKFFLKFWCLKQLWSNDSIDLIVTDTFIQMVKRPNFSSAFPWNKLILLLFIILIVSKISQQMWPSMQKSNERKSDCKWSI